MLQKFFMIINLVCTFFLKEILNNYIKKKHGIKKLNKD